MAKSWLSVDLWGLAKQLSEGGQNERCCDCCWWRDVWKKNILMFEKDFDIIFLDVNFETCYSRI